jgi:hypothetical protein
VKIVALALLAACGRIGFAEHTGASDAAGTADGARDSARDAIGSDAAMMSTITHVGTFVVRHPGAGSTDTFSTQAGAAGDVIAMQLGCGSSTMPTGVTIAAAGWTFDQLHASEGVNPLWAARFVAIAPDTNTVTMAVTWTGSPCDIGTSVLSDEFAGVDTSGGVGMVATAGSQASGTGTCTSQITTVTANETVWAACFSSGGIIMPGPGYKLGAQNGGGDGAEYRITNDPAGTLETPTYLNNGGYLLDVVTLRSR